MTPLFDGCHRWLPALFVLARLNVVQRPVRHEPRRAGISKYTATGRAGPIAREAVSVLGITLRQRRRLVHRLGAGLDAHRRRLLPPAEG
jgi:dolichol-phosphate mannosyltransferase